MTERLIPARTMDRAVALIQAHGTDQERAALYAAIEQQYTDRKAARRAMVAIAEGIRQRRRRSHR